jgi:hypothetical protein
LQADAELVLPEWREGYCTRPDDSPAAYSIEDTRGHRIKIKARLRRSDPRLQTIEVRAVDDHPGGNVLGRVAARSVSFGASGQTVMEDFELEDVKLDDWGVGRRTVVWRWEFRDPGGDWKTVATTRHRIYSVLSVPSAPWQQQPFASGNTQLLWTSALDYACEWAFGAGAL